MTDITTKLPVEIATAIKRAYALGQLYCQQADSDSYKQNAKSDETQAKFDDLLSQTSANAQEAADEIDRLRAEVAGKDAEIERLNFKIADLRDEVAMFCGYDDAKEMDAATKGGW